MKGCSVDHRIDIADRAAISLSFICVVHCIAVAVLVGVLPAMAASLPFEHWVHDVLFWLAVPVSAFALIGGFRQHTNIIPSVVVTVGLGLMFFAFFVFHDSQWETWLSLAGAAVVACGHIVNYHLLRRLP